MMLRWYHLSERINVVRIGEEATWKQYHASIICSIYNQSYRDHRSHAPKCLNEMRKGCDQSEDQLMDKGETTNDAGIQHILLFKPYRLGQVQ